MSTLVFSSVVSICSCGKMWNRRRITDQRETNCDHTSFLIHCYQTECLHNTQICHLMQPGAECETFAMFDGINITKRKNSNALGESDLIREQTYGVLYTCGCEAFLGCLGPWTMAEGELCNLFPTNPGVSGRIQSHFVVKANGVCQVCIDEGRQTASNRATTRPMNREEQREHAVSDECYKILAFGCENTFEPRPFGRFEDLDDVHDEHCKAVMQKIDFQLLGRILSSADNTVPPALGRRG